MSPNRLLIVDDNTEILAIWREYLLMFDEFQCEIVTASNPIEALKQCEKAKQDFDLIITDYDMPYMLGTQFIMYLREQLSQSYGHTPIFLCSATIKNFEHLKVESDNIYFLNKPIDRKKVGPLILDLFRKAS